VENLNLSSSDISRRDIEEIVSSGEHAAPNRIRETPEKLIGWLPGKCSNISVQSIIIYYLMKYFEFKW